MKEFFARLLAFEPVQVRAVLMALVVAAGAFGLSEVGPWADKVDTAWTALFAVIPLIQGWVTRPAVTPNAKVEAVAQPSAGRNDRTILDV